MSERCHFHKFILFSFLALLTGSCANIVSPSGGNKDISPPIIIKSEPANFSTGFNGGTIRLYFDEFVMVKDESKNLLISPSFQTRPEIKIKGKSIILTLKDSLHSNTTYNFNFGKAIQDITEGNPLINNQFVFSTGDAIDTLALSGKVTDAFTHTPVKDAAVMLYSKNEDSVPFREAPLYVTKTAEDGSYQLRFLGAGPYKIVALIDKNGNYMFDGSEEDIGFSEQTVRPEGVIRVSKTFDYRDSVIVVNAGPPIDMMTFRDAGDSIQRTLKPSLVKAHQLLIPFRFPLQSPTITTFGDTATKAEDWALKDWNRRMDSLTLWLNPALKADSLFLLIADGDSFRDTLRLNLQNMGKSGRLKKQGAEEKASVTSNASMQFGLNQDFILTSAYPIQSYDFSGAKLITGNDTLPARLVIADSMKRIARIAAPFKESTEYKIIIPANSFVNRNGQTNDTLRFSWRTKSLKDYGELKVIIALKTPGNYIVQVLNNKNVAIRQSRITGNTSLAFTFLEPGEYRLKMVYDKNNNGQWDTGHYLKKFQAEKISYFSKTIEVRGNWELEENWELTD